VKGGIFRISYFFKIRNTEYSEYFVYIEIYIVLTRIVIENSITSSSLYVTVAKHDTVMYTHKVPPIVVNIHLRHWVNFCLKSLNNGSLALPFNPKRLHLFTIHYKLKKDAFKTIFITVEFDLIPILLIF